MPLLRSYRVTQPTTSPCPWCGRIAEAAAFLAVIGLVLWAVGAL